MSTQEPLKDFSSQPLPDNSGRKRAVSERRVQANRRNALRSTGPKTARGKRTVARNAIKHGFLTREVVITAGDGEESLEEFHALAARFWECYEPLGVVEESLVQTIVTCWWRKARVIRAENGEIRRRLDTLAVDRALRYSDKGNLDLALIDSGLYDAANPADGKVSTTDRWSAWQSAQSAQSDMRAHHHGLIYLSTLLKQAKSEIGSDGYISENLQERIFFAFNLWDCTFALACFHAAPPESKVQGQPPVSPDIVALIDDRLKRISAFEEHATEREELGRDAEARSFSLPPSDSTDKVLRYEAHIDRQLYRAMDQLERLQRRRKGETVPPPLNINLSKRS